MDKRQRRNLVNSGLKITLVAAALTGLRILRPMKLHPVAGYSFLAFTLAHLLVNTDRSRRRTDRPHRVD